MISYVLRISIKENRNTNWSCDPKKKDRVSILHIFLIITYWPLLISIVAKGCEFLTQMVPDDPPVTLKFTGRETRACHELAAICADALAKNCELCATVVGNNDSDCSVQLEFKQDVFEPTERVSWSILLYNYMYLHNDWLNDWLFLCCFTSPRRSHFTLSCSSLRKQYVIMY